MNIPAYPDAPLEYREGHRDARHAAASVALEAETDIVWLRAEVERLTESRRVIAGGLEREEERNADLEARVAELTAALRTIAAYGDDGICPYGCDTPHIARAALAAEKGDEHE